MKNPTFTAYFFGLSLIATLTLPRPAGAAIKYWDINGSTPGSGQGTNTEVWNTTGALWSTDSTGSSAPTTFATGDMAVFSAGTDATNAFTINLTAGVTTSGFTVEEGAMTLSGTAVTIGTNAVTINSGAKLTIPSSAFLASTAGAQIILNGGTIEDSNLGANGSFVMPSTVIVLNGGGTLSYTTANVLNIISTGTPGTTISGTGPLIKGGAGVLALATTGNTWTGGTIITNGELRIRTSNNTLPTSTAVTVTSPGILNLNGLSQTIGSLTGNGTVGLGNGTLTLGGDNSSTTFSGVIVDVSSSGSGGVSSGTGHVTKTGGGTFTLSASNNYSGPTLITQGTLALTNGGAIGPSAVTVSALAALASVATVPTTIAGTTVFNSGAFASFAAVGGSPGAVGNISVIGTGKNLTFNNNAVIINVTGSALTAGTYRLMDCTGTLTGSANASPGITGIALTGGLTATISTTTGAAGHMDLVVAVPSVHITGITTLGDGTKQLNFSGAAGQNYLIQGATNLAPPVTWTNLSTNMAAGDGSFNYNDTNSTNFGTRFYRTAIPGP